MSRNAGWQMLCASRALSRIDMLPNIINMIILRTLTASIQGGAKGEGQEGENRQGDDNRAHGSWPFLRDVERRAHQRIGE